MFRIYVLLAIRNLRKNRLYSIINACGLALGLAAGFLILSWVIFELNYDRSHTDYQRIYRLVGGDKGSISAAMSPVAKTNILNKIPEVQYSVRLFKASQVSEKTKVTVSDNIYTNEEILFVDADFFHVFSFPLLKGNIENVFNKPNAVVLAHSIAKKYFGDTDPIGKTIYLSDSKQLEVTGVVEDAPVQSHFHFDLLVSIKAHPWGGYMEESDIGSTWMFHTYIKLYPKVSAVEVEQKCNEIGGELTAKLSSDYKLNFVLQPLKDIHLKSAIRKELEVNKDIRYIYLFSGIALLVIVIAGINFVNLTTAGSFSRLKEVGVRKVLGAKKRQLIFQHLVESLLIGVVALVLALLIIELARPLLTSFTGENHHPIFGQVELLPILILSTILTVLVSGIAPALMLSSHQPYDLFKGVKRMAEMKGRKVLVVFQFGISLFLLISTIVVYQQLDFMQHKKLGYNKEQTMVLFTGYSEFKYDTFKELLLSDSRITSITGASSLPTNIEAAEYIDTSGEEELWTNYITVNNDFFKTLDIQIVSKYNEGESHRINEYSNNKYYVNQSFIKALGWQDKDAIGRQITIRHGNMMPGSVVGIVKDFHFRPLHFPITPLVFEFGTENWQYVLVKYNSENVREVVSYVEEQWGEMENNLPFGYSFLDQEYASLYKNEAVTAKLFMLFSGLSILIAILGMFGLASHAAFKRTKEIGIRKVFGAVSLDVLFLLFRDFAQLVVISFLIAVPLVLYFLDFGLQSFAYRVEVSPVLVILTGLFVMLLALLTVGYHSIRASNTNPIETLKDE